MMKIKLEKIKSCFVQKLHEGSQAPKFFLPVKQDYYTYSTVYYFFLLAPAALSFYLLKSGFQSIWLDLITIGSLWQKKLKERRNNVNQKR